MALIDFAPPPLSASGTSTRTTIEHLIIEANQIQGTIEGFSNLQSLHLERLKDTSLGELGIGTSLSCLKKVSQRLFQA